MKVSLPMIEKLGSEGKVFLKYGGSTSHMHSKNALHITNKHWDSNSTALRIGE